MHFIFPKYASKYIYANMFFGSFCGNVHFFVPSLYRNITLKNTLGLQFLYILKFNCYLNNYTFLNHHFFN